MQTPRSVDARGKGVGDGRDAKGEGGSGQGAEEVEHLVNVERPVQFDACADIAQHRYPDAIAIRQFGVVGDVDISKWLAVAARRQGSTEEEGGVLAQMATGGAEQQELAILSHGRPCG